MYVDKIEIRTSLINIELDLNIEFIFIWDRKEVTILNKWVCILYFLSYTFIWDYIMIESFFFFLMGWLKSMTRRER